MRAPQPCGAAGPGVRARARAQAHQQPARRCAHQNDLWTSGAAPALEPAMETILLRERAPETVAVVGGEAAP